MEGLLRTLAREVQDELDGMLGQTIQMSEAHKGTLQIYDPSQDLLRIISHNGFSPRFLEHFQIVKPFDGSACGRAAGTGITVNVNDVFQDAAFRPHKDTALAAGFRAVQSVPLFVKGQLVGVVSVHFRDPRKNIPRNSLDSITPAIAVTLHGIIEMASQQAVGSE